MEEARIVIRNGHKIAEFFLDAGGKDIVIFCHGYRSSSIGPSRFFVRVARMLAEHGISSLRFDQFGSGNSEGDFKESSFNDWLATTAAIVESYKKEGYRVCLFGQSMGGATVLKVAAQTPELAAVVAWVPDPSVDPFEAPPSGVFEEGGQIVQASFWEEAHDARIADTLGDVRAAVYIVQCSEDEYVSPENHQAIIKHAAPHHNLEMYEGYRHSSWSYDQARQIITKSVDFLVTALQ